MIVHGNPSGPQVVRSDDIMGFQEVATYLGISKQRVSVLRKRPDFPKPLCVLASTPIWDARSVAMYKLQRYTQNREKN